MEEANSHPVIPGEEQAPADPLLLKLAQSGQGITVEAVNSAVVRGQIIELIRALTDCQNELENQADEQRNKKRSLLMKLLEVADSMDRLIRFVDSANVVANSLLVLRTQFWQVLEDEGVVPIELGIGQAFDPALCEISQREVRPDLAPNTIISVDRRGYTWQSKPFRRARVAISIRPGA